MVDLKKCKLFDLKGIISTLDKSRGRDAVKQKLFSNQNIQVIGDMDFIGKSLFSSGPQFPLFSIGDSSQQKLHKINSTQEGPGYSLYCRL